MHNHQQYGNGYVWPHSVFGQVNCPFTISFFTLSIAVNTAIRNDYGNQHLHIQDRMDSDAHGQEIECVKAMPLRGLIG